MALTTVARETCHCSARSGRTGACSGRELAARDADPQGLRDLFVLQQCHGSPSEVASWTGPPVRRILPPWRPPNPPEVTAFYAHVFDEGARLTSSADGRLELLRTQEFLRRYLPEAPARVLDVGGGTGVHARWLVEDGYEVDLVDPVPRHVEQARQVCPAELGDARGSPPVTGRTTRWCSWVRCTTCPTAGPAPGAG